LESLGVTKKELYESYERLLESDDFPDSFYAARALAKLKNPLAKDVLTKGLTGRYSVDDFYSPRRYGLSLRDKQKVREHIAMISAFSLAELGEPQAIDCLINILSDSEEYNSSTRAYATYCLGKFQDEKITEPLLKTATDENEDVRAMVIWSLGERREAEAFDIFIATASDNNEKIMNEAITGLGKLGDLRALPYIEAILREEQSSKTKIRGVIALNQIVGDKENSQITDLIIELLNKARDNDVKLACVNGLRGSKDPRVRGIVNEYLNYKEDLRLRQSALLSLGEYSDKEAIDQIEKMTSDKDPKTRQIAVLIAADKLKDNPQLFDSLYQRLDDSTPEISSTTVVALTPHIVDYPQLREPIEQALKESTNPYGVPRQGCSSDRSEGYCQRRNPAVRQW